MELLVYDNNQQTGPFTIQTVQEMFASGAISPNAHVWHEGAPNWIPVGAFLAQNAPASVAAPAAAARAMRFQPSALATSAEVPNEGALFIKAALWGLGVAVVSGLCWAALQVFATPRLQLPYAIGIGLAYLCCHTVDKASSESSGGLYLLLHFACIVVLWGLGIFGVVLMGGIAIIGIYTIAGFVLSLIIAWWKANN
jgi:hypothetical protein